jgi:NADPH:quinone reductase-like Zn-dependent oxidoreductase
MRAALIRSHGQPPEYQDHPVPRRGAGQALIRVTAAPVCPLDLLCASGTSYFGPPPLPYAPGAQGVGTVEEADTLPAGQRVWFSCDAGMKPGDGAMAELCVAEESSVLPLPGYVSDDLVAALGLSAIAAWTALALRAGLRPGEHVLVLGASGTVGQVGVQAARLLGAGRVTAACRDAHGRARAAELGADAVADLTADDTDTLTAGLAEAAGGRVDLVLDPVWGKPAEAALRRGDGSTRAITVTRTPSRERTGGDTGELALAAGRPGYWREPRGRNLTQARTPRATSSSHGENRTCRAKPKTARPTSTMRTKAMIAIMVIGLRSCRNG